MVDCMTSIVLVFLLVLINGTSSAKVCNSYSENWQSRIGILISPIVTESKIREIEIYWNNLKIEPGDTISLYENSLSGAPVVIYTVTPNSSSGVQKTGILAEYVPSSNLSYVPKCLKYGVAWSTENEEKRKECLKTEPTWMKERKNIVGPLKMSQIFLPGTHDSASYDEEGNKRSILARFAVTQDLDILGQLIHGVRYLDIRVGRYTNDEIWWTNHGPFYRSVSLKTVIDQVRQFLDNTEEILIMDIREFAVGFTNLSDHEALVSYLENEFRDYYLANNHGWNITLNDIWSSGRRLIIGYENTRIVEYHASMWPCVAHQWGNVRRIEDLYKYLRKIENNDRGSRVRPRSAMAELTATLKDIVFNTLGDLRDMAHTVNSNITNWYSTIWQYSANIVAVDFLRSSDIVRIAIESNENRHLHCRY
ncbi:PREDICTED: PI-PLC X domain-containing protein 1-like [Habropoda laboriosa]|uniref:PI-PLC X domain-containing protein 1-like n=1 Tax=Habropoda laboriosa TaxID=597456 RepID=UPI00083D111C|nr:PREDICTED: PI-PLC X domain-containing protein 1-like [Habropoda laboriosa]